MKTKDLPIFKQKILDMLPVTQADMWKKLEINSKEGSHIVNIMLKEHLLTRRRKDKSFILEKLNGSGKDQDDDIKKKEAVPKKKTEEDLKKKEVVPKKKKTEEDLKKKEAVPKKKKKTEEDLKKKEAVPKKKKETEEDLKKETEEDLKKETEEDLKKETEEDLNRDIDFVTTTCDKNIQNIKTKDINILKQEVLDILPILQKDIWKKLDACDCHYLGLIDLMVKENLITRTKQGKFVLLEEANGDKHKHVTKIDVPIIPPVQQVQNKKPKDTNDLKKSILDMLPIAPSDLLEKLDVSSRVCSNTINEMIEEDIIVRTEKNGRFLLEKINKIAKKRDTNHAAMISSRKRFTPCCGCVLECDAATCILLTEWLLE